MFISFLKRAMLVAKASDSGDFIMRLFSLTTLASSLILTGWLVVPAQAETIDADGSGVIDEQELANLYKKARGEKLKKKELKKLLL